MRHRARARGFRAFAGTSLMALLLLAGCVAGFSGCGKGGSAYVTPAGTTTLTVGAIITNGSVNPQPTATVQLQLIVN